MSKEKIQFYFWSMGALGDGLSGSDRIFIELARRFSKKHLVNIFLWEEGLKMCKRQKLSESAGLKFKILKMGIWCKFGFFLCYISRIIRSAIEASKVNLHSKRAVVYSASEFWMDSVPALILKLRYPKIIWVAAWYQTAPNPWKGFSEGQRDRRYRIRAFFYWFVQLFIKPFIARYADLVLINNEEERKQFPKLNQEERVQVVLGAIDLENIKLWQNDNNHLPKIYDAVFQGRFHPQKGILELIDIWKLVVKQKQQAKLALIGDGLLTQEVEFRIKELGLENNIKLFGYVYDGPEKYRIFAQSKLVVHPAFYDSGGMAAAEAMAFGLPAVGFDLKSYQTYYPRGMIKVKFGDINSFAKTVIELLGDGAFRKKIGIEALKMIGQSMSWEIRASEILQRIEEIKPSLPSIRKFLIPLFIAAISLISLATFREAFGFDLRGEDWYQLWFAIYPDLKDAVFKTIIFRDHPISTYQELAFGKFFGFNPFYWHLFGYFVKIIDALAVGLLAQGITSSRRAAIYSSLIFAASVIGLEGFISLYAQNAGIVVFLFCVGLYFWVISGNENSLKKYLIATTFFLAAILGDPGRGISMIVLGLLWDVLCLFRNTTRNNVIRIIARNSFVITASISLYFLIGVGVEEFKAGHPANLFNGLSFIATNLFLVSINLINSLGILLIGWFIKIFESGYMSHMTYLNSTPFISGSIFLIVYLVILSKLFFNRNNRYYHILLFFMSWVIISFVPTWILLQWYIGGLLPGVSGRYFTLPSVGLIILMSYILSQRKAIFVIFFLIFILVFNIRTSNRILREEWNEGSVVTHNLFWDEVDKVLPREGKSIILFSGTTHLASELAAAYAIPVGLKRGVNKAEDLPIVTSNRELVKRMLCEDNVSYQSFLGYSSNYSGMILQKEKIPFSRLYAWRFSEDAFINVTNQERRLLVSEVSCKLD